MLPADSVFAIGGEDESEAEEDLLAEGTRRLGAIAANVSPTEGASSSREGTTGTDAPETLSCVTVPPVSPAHPFEFGSSPAAGVLHSQEGTRRFLESYHCGVGSSGRGTPSLCSTGGGHEQAGRVAERGSDSSNSSSRISAVHRTSAVDGNTSVYRPEVDGPPIVGYGMSLLTPLSLMLWMSVRRMVLLAGLDACFPQHLCSGAISAAEARSTVSSSARKLRMHASPVTRPFPLLGGNVVLSYHPPPFCLVHADFPYFMHVRTTIISRGNRG